MKSNAQLAPTILSLSSTLRSSIALSFGMKIASRFFGLVEKHQVLQAAEVKYGRVKINPETGRPATEEMMIEIEIVGQIYACIMDTFPEQQTIIGSSGEMFGFSPDAFAASRSTPFVRSISNEEAAIVAKAGQINTATVMANRMKLAEQRADAFSRKSSAIVAEVESLLAFADPCDLCDIPETDLEFYGICETAVAKYTAKVAAGQKFDVADMVLFNDDCEKLDL